MEGLPKSPPASAPHIISISAGHNLRDESQENQLSELPGSLAALEARIQAAVASGIIVVFSAGNGEFSFPGMMPDVISVGGVFVDRDGNRRASDLASAFDSKIYSGRHVPDFCELKVSGVKNLSKNPSNFSANPSCPLDKYIMSPIPGPALNIECTSRVLFPRGGTEPDDGWAAFSGTSAAAPQIAGVCALLMAKNPTLTPSDIKAVLRRTARDVLVGNSNPDSSDDRRTFQQAGPGDDGATGAGLVDAFSAWQQV